MSLAFGTLFCLSALFKIMSTLSARRDQNRNSIPAGSRKVIREHRRIGDIQRFCAEQTKTVARGEDASGETHYDVRTKYMPDHTNRMTFAQAETIVAEEMKRLARRTKPVHVPDDHNTPGFGQALAERCLQLMAQCSASVSAAA